MLSPEDQQAVRQQQMGGLLNALGQASMPTRAPIPIGAVLAQAAQGMNQGQQQGIDNVVGNRSKLMQMQQMQQQMDQQQKQRQFMQQFSSSLPEQMRPLADAFPEHVAKSVLESTFAKPAKPELVEVEDPNNPGRTVKQWVVPGQTRGATIGSSPRKAPDGFTYGPSGGLVPDSAYWAQKERVARAGASNINMPMQEKEENKAVGKFFGEQYADTQKAGLSATSKINKYNRLNQLLEGVNTGKLTPLGVEVASAAQSLGFSIDPNLSNKQAAEALSNEMALELRNPSGGAGMPGAMSDQDRAYLQNMVPGLSKTPEGRKMMTETATQLAKRDQDVARLARAYRAKRGTIDEGFYEELQRFAETNPLFRNSGITGVRRTGTINGRKVIERTDGTIEYAD